MFSRPHVKIHHPYLTGTMLRWDMHGGILSMHSIPSCDSQVLFKVHYVAGIVLNQMSNVVGTRNYFIIMCTIKQNTALPAAIPAPRACGHSRLILKDLVCERWGQHAAEPILSAAHSALDFKTFGGSKTNLAIETVTTAKNWCKLLQSLAPWNSSGWFHGVFNMPMGRLHERSGYKQ